MQVQFNGRTSAFQADDVGSIPLPAPDKTNGKSFVFIFFNIVLCLATKLKSYSYKKYELYIQEEVKIMNKYESVIIINPNIDEAALKSFRRKNLQD